MRQSITITRPANVTAYTANDVIGDVDKGAALELPGMAARNGMEIMITSAKLEADIAAIPAGMTSFRVHLYKAKPASALPDNGAHDVPAGDRVDYLGYFDFGNIVDLGSTLYIQADSINKHIKLSDTDTSLWFYLTTIGGFTPAANSEVYKLTMCAQAILR